MQAQLTSGVQLAANVEEDVTEALKKLQDTEVTLQNKTADSGAGRLLPPAGNFMLKMIHQSSNCKMCLVEVREPHVGHVPSAMLSHIQMKALLRLLYGCRNWLCWALVVYRASAPALLHAMASSVAKLGFVIRTCHSHSQYQTCMHQECIGNFPLAAMLR